MCKFNYIIYLRIVYRPDIVELRANDASHQSVIQDRIRIRNRATCFRLFRTKRSAHCIFYASIQRMNFDFKSLNLLLKKINTNIKYVHAGFKTIKVHVKYINNIFRCLPKLSNNHQPFLYLLFHQLDPCS